MSESSFAGLQGFLASPFGSSLVAAVPSLHPLQTIVASNPASPHLRQALGPLGANLPRDFPARVAAANAEASAEAVSRLIARAYEASIPAALAEIDARALAAANAAASDDRALNDLAPAAAALGFYALYGDVARERAALFAQKAAAARSRQLAEALARELQASSDRPAPAAVAAGPTDGEGFARSRARLSPAIPAEAVEKYRSMFAKWHDAILNAPAGNRPIIARIPIDVMQELLEIQGYDTGYGVVDGRPVLIIRSGPPDSALASIIASGGVRKLGGHGRS